MGCFINPLICHVPKITTTYLMALTVDTDYITVDGYILYRHKEDGDGEIVDVWSDLDGGKIGGPVKKKKKVNILRKALKEMVTEQRMREQEVTDENLVETEGQACKSDQPKVTRKKVKLQALILLPYTKADVMIKIINRWSLKP